MAILARVGAVQLSPRTLQHMYDLASLDQAAAVQACLEFAADMRLSKGGMQEAGSTTLHGLMRVSRGNCCDCVGVHNASLLTCIAAALTLLH